MLLQGGRVIQGASIRDMVTLESLLPTGIALELGGADGRAALTRTAAGAWEAHLAVSPGARYRLTGRVDGRSVEGRVDVPGTLLVRAPRDGGTIRFPRNGFTSPVPIDVEAAGAAGYGVEQLTLDGQVIHIQWLTSGVDTVDAAYTVDPVIRFRVYALEASAWAFLRGLQPPTSLTGIRGFLGAVVIDSVTLTIVR